MHSFTRSRRLWPVRLRSRCAERKCRAYFNGGGEMCQSELTRICWANVGKGVCEMNTLAVIIPFCGSRGLIGKLYGGLWCGARRTRNALINRSSALAGISCLNFCAPLLGSTDRTLSCVPNNTHTHTRARDHAYMKVHTHTYTHFDQPPGMAQFIDPESAESLLNAP